MRRYMFCIAMLFVLALVLRSEAAEQVSCRYSGGGAATDGTLCYEGNNWDVLNFGNVWFNCKYCDGSTSRVQNPATQTVTGNCLFNCGAFLTCNGCVKELSGGNLEFYVEAVDRTFNTLLMSCQSGAPKRVGATYYCDCSTGGTNPNSPILISLSGRLELTAAEQGVHFDLDADGKAELTAWTALDSDEGFLALDRDLNGQIDDYSEIFGNKTEQFPSDEPNGWRALAIWDDGLNGGNADGVIDAADWIFASLRLWVDKDHNGISEPSELMDLTEAGIVSLDLDFHKSERRDRHGNLFKFWSQVETTHGVVVAWDVFLVSE